MRKVAILGAGQLARMTYQAAIALNVPVRILANTKTDPAAAVANEVSCGDFTNATELKQALIGVDVLTFEHELIATELLNEIENTGIKVYPNATALKFAKNKLAMRNKMAQLGLPIPKFAHLTKVQDLLDFYATYPNLEVVIKTITGGYDGRGVWITTSMDEAIALVTKQLTQNQELLVEEKLTLQSELAVLVARSPFGQVAVWPVIETIQSKGQCAYAIAPHRFLASNIQDKVSAMAIKIATELNVVGVLAVEMFHTQNNEILINELAMRPHNSGHLTMTGSVTSQFEQHLRAVLDYPLGKPNLIGKQVVMANILGADPAIRSIPTMTMDERVHHLMARFPNVKINLYGKAERPNRKIGHVNVLKYQSDNAGFISATDMAKGLSCLEIAKIAAHWLSYAHWLDDWSIHNGRR